MPIHDQSYRRFGRPRTTGRRAWTVITRVGVRGFLAKRGFLVLLLAAWLPFVVRTIQIYAAANLPQAAFLVPTAATFRQFLRQQDIFVFLVTVYVGAGLIANDRRANALQIYLSKPLTRIDYVLGKLGILLILILTVTWIPAVLLLIIQVAFAGNLTFFRDNLFLFPAITFYTLVEASTGATSILALSSLSNNGRFAGILYAGLIFFSQALFGVLRIATGDAWWSWISVTNDMMQVGDIIFRLPLRQGAPWPMQLIVIVALIGVSLVILDRRVRGVEVVT